MSNHLPPSVVFVLGSPSQSLEALLQNITESYETLQIVTGHHRML